MRFCINCLARIEEDAVVCKSCGKDPSAYVEHHRALPPLTLLNGKYIIGKVIGEGGFGITYLGCDLNIDRKVAIKEYYPTNLVSRDTSDGITTSISVITNGDDYKYKKGMQRFVAEAANLARFNDLPGIVSVKDFFYENNTAYIVMEYIDGITLSQYLIQHGNRLPYDQVIDMMKPIMDSLQTVHEAGIIHRDISPDNIMITKEGEMKLIDFGAARFVGNNDAKSLTVILKHGYAPPEQYQTDGKQGPWTDVYALAATMYRMITGEVLQEATERILSQDNNVKRNLYKNSPKYISRALYKALVPRISHRTKSITDFGEDFFYGNNGIKIIYSIIGAIVLLIIVFFIWALNNDFNNKKGVRGEYSNTDFSKNSENDYFDMTISDNVYNEEKTLIDKEEEISLPVISEEYNAYKEYFSNNVDIQEGNMYYVYFYDVQHKGIDDMIVVDDNKRCSFITFKNGYAYEYYTSNGEELYVAIDKDEIVLCSNNSDSKDNHYIIYYMDADKSDPRVKIDDFTIEGYEYDRRRIDDDYLTTHKYLNNVFCITDTLYYEGTSDGCPVDSYGDAYYYNSSYTCIAANHEYKALLDDVKKLIKTNAMEIDILKDENKYGDQYRLLTFIVIDNYNDEDDNLEIISTYRIDSEQTYDDPYFSECYEFQYIDYSKATNRLLASYEGGCGGCIGIRNLNFGRIKGLAVVEPGTSGDLYTDIYAFERGEETIFEGIDSVGIDSAGIYMLCYGGDFAPGDYPLMDYGITKQKFYISFLNQEFIEYDSVEIDMNELLRLTNGRETLESAESTLGDRWSWDIGRKYYFRIKNILYSSNDMIYINYIVGYDDLVNPDAYDYIKEWYEVGVFKVEDGELFFVDKEYRERLLTTGCGMKSYIVDFPY